MRRACARLMRDREQLRALRSFAEPILAEMADWPAVAALGRLADGARTTGAARDCETGARAARAARAGAARGHRPGAPARSSRRADAAAVDADA